MALRCLFCSPNITKEQGVSTAAVLVSEMGNLVKGHGGVSMTGDAQGSHCCARSHRLAFAPVQNALLRPCYK